MNQYLLVLIAFAFSMQSFTGPKKDLKERVEAFLELSLSVSEDSDKEIQRIKTFLEPSIDQDHSAILLYQMWRQELASYGKQDKKVQKIVFLNKDDMAFVDISLARNIPRKGAKKKGAVDKEFFTMKATWIKVDGQWVQRTKMLAREAAEQ